MMQLDSLEMLSAKVDKLKAENQRLQPMLKYSFTQDQLVENEAPKLVEA